MFVYEVQKVWCSIHLLCYKVTDCISGRTVSTTSVTTLELSNLCVRKLLACLYNVVQCSSFFISTVYQSGKYVFRFLSNLLRFLMLPFESYIKMHVFHYVTHALSNKFFCIWLWLSVLFRSLRSTILVHYRQDKPNKLWDFFVSLQSLVL